MYDFTAYTNDALSLLIVALRAYLTLSHRAAARALTSRV